MMNRRDAIKATVMTAMCAAVPIHAAAMPNARHSWTHRWTGNGVRGERDWFAIGLRDDGHSFTWCGMNNTEEQALAVLDLYLDFEYVRGHVHAWEG